MLCKSRNKGKSLTVNGVCCLVHAIVNITLLSYCTVENIIQSAVQKIGGDYQIV